MAINDFSAEAADNYEQKCLCVLVLDVSGSMHGAPIKELNNGLQDFHKEISADDSTNQKLEVCLMTFNHRVTTVQNPALVGNFTMPRLSADGSTAMVTAVNEAIDKVAARKQWYKDTGQNYYRPWIILITDGEPDPEQDIAGLAARIEADTNAKRYAFLPIGVEDANMSVLGQIANGMPVMKMKGLQFSSFFKWLSASIGGAITNAEGGQSAPPPRADDWMADIFKI